LTIVFPLTALGALEAPVIVASPAICPCTTRAFLQTDSQLQLRIVVCGSK
ncbi:1784_t:CDS:2, partial [Rhizophagus irregularis]